MATNLDIVNAALVELGANPVDDFTSDKYGRTAKTLYDLEKPRILRLHPWSIFRGRTTLTTPLATPPFDWLYAFALPGDLARLYQVGTRQCPIDYELVLEVSNTVAIMANVASVPIVYTKGEVSETLWPDWFVDLMAKAMKARIAYAVTNSRTTAQDCKEEFEAELSRCRGLQGSEVLSEDLGLESDFLAARY